MYCREIETQPFAGRRTCAKNIWNVEFWLEPSVLSKYDYRQCICINAGNQLSVSYTPQQHRNVTSGTNEHRWLPSQTEPKPIWNAKHVLWKHIITVPLGAVGLGGLPTSHDPWLKKTAHPRCNEMQMTGRSCSFSSCAERSARAADLCWQTALVKFPAPMHLTKEPCPPLHLIPLLTYFLPSVVWQKWTEHTHTILGGHLVRKPASVCDVMGQDTICAFLTCLFLLFSIQLPVPIAVFLLLYKERLVPCCPHSSPPLLSADELALETRIAEKDDSSTSSPKLQPEIGEKNCLPVELGTDVIESFTMALGRPRRPALYVKQHIVLL